MNLTKCTALMTACTLLTGCSSAVSAKAADLMKDIQPQQQTSAACDAEFSAAQNRFALRLLQKAADPQKNTMLSPYSVMQTLAMTANGAGGVTRTEMTEALGGLPAERLNPYLFAWRTGQPQDDLCKLTTANSIWLPADENAPEISRAFLQMNADYYGAGAFRLPFDGKAPGVINGWVKEHTDGMVPEIIKEIPPNAAMYLINATAFDAKWADPYQKENVRDAAFFCADGTQKTVPMMYSSESEFLTGAHVTGFRKAYAGWRYAFAALLPEEGLTVDDFVQQLTPDALRTLLNEPEPCSVRAGIPKFSFDFGTDLCGAMTAMGMGSAFSPETADFSQMLANGGKDLYISKLLHKTHIEVSESGTKAAASTAAELKTRGAAPVQREETVILDRPFVCAVLDLDTGIPVFLGIVRDPA